MICCSNHCWSLWWKTDNHANIDMMTSSWLSLLKMQQATNFINLHNIWRVIKFAYVCLVLIKFPYVCLMCIHSKQKNSLWGKQIKIYFLKFDLMQLGEWCPNIKSDSISALHFLLRSNNPALREMIRPTERDEALLYSNISNINIYAISKQQLLLSSNAMVLRNQISTEKTNIFYMLCFATYCWEDTVAIVSETAHSH